MYLFVLCRSDFERCGDVYKLAAVQDTKENAVVPIPRLPCKRRHPAFSLFSTSTSCSSLLSLFFFSSLRFSASLLCFSLPFSPFSSLLFHSLLFSAFPAMIYSSSFLSSLVLFFQVPKTEYRIIAPQPGGNETNRVLDHRRGVSLQFTTTGKYYQVNSFNVVLVLLSTFFVLGDILMIWQCFISTVYDIEEATVEV
jgi:hypothetical protein